jgi:hypothetical protein
MRAITGFVVVLLVTLPSSAQETGRKVEVQAKTPDYYPLKAGSKWHYVGELSNGRKFMFLCQVSKIEEDAGKRLVRVETIVNGGLMSAERVYVDAGGVFRDQTDGSPVSPPECLLKYPVKEGESWTSKFKNGDESVTVEAKAGKLEEVQVPAGKYRAIAVQSEMTGSESTVRVTTWFAPGVGIIKQSIENQGARRGFQVKRELAKYEDGK